MTPPLPLWIVDSSPLIALAKVGQLDLLTASSRRDARRAASALGIQVAGTVGVALQARQTGRIPALAPLLHDLRAAGLFLPNDALLNEVLKTVGEIWP